MKMMMMMKIDDENNHNHNHNNNGDSAVCGKTYKAFQIVEFALALAAHLMSQFSNEQYTNLLSPPPHNPPPPDFGAKILRDFQKFQSTLPLTVSQTGLNLNRKITTGFWCNKAAAFT